MQSSKKSKLLVMSLTLAMALTSCSTQIGNTSNPEKISNTAKTDIAPTDLIENNSPVQLSGTVHFPEIKLPVNIKNRGFDLKSVSEDVRSGATVSLLYPPDFTVEEPCFSICASIRESGGFTPGPNVTIATGLTKSNSSFKINIDKDKFTPDTETIYVLEAEKRLGGSSNYIVTLRTFVRWTGTKWESITKSKIDLDLSSTALTIISSWEPEELPPEDTIGMISTSGGVAMVDYDNLPVERIKVEEVIGLENQAIAQNQDPFAAIFYQALGPAGEYDLKETPQITEDVQVNTETGRREQNPAVAKNSEGDYVIAWESGDPYFINAQRYNKAGRAIGSEFPVNNPTLVADIHNPAVAMANDGSFVVTWDGRDAGDSAGVFARLFDKDGNPGSQFLVNTYTTLTQADPAVAMESNGSFVITWDGEGAGEDGTSKGIFGQRFDKDGVKLIPSNCPAATCNATTGEFLVNTYTTGTQIDPAIAMDGDGDFAITWRGEYHQDGEGYGVFAQRYNKTAAKAGTEFLVNNFTSFSQLNPSIAMDNDGDFVIAWQGFGLNFTRGIFARKYNASGVSQVPVKCGTDINPDCDSQTGEFEIDTNSINPVVAMDYEGDFVVTWQKEDGYWDGTFGQRYNKSSAKQGEEFQVNNYTFLSQINPAIAMDSAGDFVVAWDGEGAGDSSGISAQRFNAYAIPQEFTNQDP